MSSIYSTAPQLQVLCNVSYDMHNFNNPHALDMQLMQFINASTADQAIDACLQGTALRIQRQW